MMDCYFKKWNCQIGPKNALHEKYGTAVVLKEYNKVKVFAVLVCFNNEDVEVLILSTCEREFI